MKQIFKAGYKVFLVILNIGVGISAGIYLLMRYRARITKKNTKQIEMLTYKKSDAGVTSGHAKTASKPTHTESSSVLTTIEKSSSNAPKTASANGGRLDEVYKQIKTLKAVDMATLLENISGVTERTLRRDLTKLQKMKLISKEGSTKSAKYKLAR